MISEQSRQSSQLDSYHGDINPGLGAGFALFVIPHETTVTHQPAESAFYHPTSRKNFESARILATFDDLYLELGSQPADPLGKVGATVAAIHPEDSQPRKPGQCLPQQGLSPFALGDARRRHDRSQNQAESVDQQMPLSSFDLFARVEAHCSTMGIGFDRLTVQNSSRGTRTLAGSLANERAKPGIERFPGVIQSPLPEDMVDCLPWGKGGWEQPPLNPSFDTIEDGIHDAASICLGPSARTRLGQKRFQEIPLFVGQVGTVLGDIHRLTELRLNCKRLRPLAKARTFFSYGEIFQTGSKLLGPGSLCSRHSITPRVTRFASLVKPACIQLTLNYPHPMPGGGKPISECNEKEVKAFLIAGTIIALIIMTAVFAKGRYTYFTLIVAAFDLFWVITLWIFCLKRLAHLKRLKQ